MKKTILAIALAMAGIATAQAAEKPMKADLIARLRTVPGVAALGCDKFQTMHYTDYDDDSAIAKGNYAIKAGKDMLNGKRLLTNPTVTCTLQRDYMASGDAPAFEVIAKESGTLNGHQMEFYHVDGSANVGGWSIGCSRDAMSDVKSCHLSNSDLFILLYADGWSVLVSGEDHYPGTGSLVRINHGKPITTSDNDGLFSRAASKRIVENLKDGGEVVTRYTNWPYNTYTDNHVNTEQVETAIGYTQILFKHY